MSRRPLPSPATLPGEAANADLAALSADELAVVAAGCDWLISRLWQRARQDHSEIDRLHARRNAALRLRGGKEKP